MSATSSSSELSKQEQVPIWLDCDTGHDDAFAILLSAQYPGAKLLGVSTVYGNAPLKRTTYNTRAILQAIGREDVPVFPGARRPLSREAIHAPDIHGETGIDGVTCLPDPTVPARTDMSAVDAMIQAISSQPKGSVWIVAVACLTNIAMLFAKRGDLVDHIAGLSIMGGAIGDHFTDAPMGKKQGEGERFGNWTPWAEFNIYIDPEAADIVFSNPALAAKTTLIPLDLTHQFLATPEIQYGFLGISKSSNTEPTMRSASQLRRLFFELLTFFAKTYAEQFGLVAGPPNHDPLAVAITLVPEFFGCNALGECGGDQNERFHVKVITEGAHASSSDITSSPSQCGRTVATLLPAGHEGVRIPRGLNVKQLWALLEGCLSRADDSIMEKLTETYGWSRSVTKTEETELN